MRSSLLIALTAVAIAAAPAAFSDPPPIKVEPNLPGPFHAFTINGKQKGKFHCFVTKHGLNPMVLIFARGSDPEQPLLELLKKLDVAANKYDTLGCSVVLLNKDILDDDQRASPNTKFEDFLKDDDQRESLSKKLDSELVTKQSIKRVIVSLYSLEGPKGYDIGMDTEVTVLLIRKHKILERFNFEKGKMTEKDVETIMATVAERVLDLKK